MFAMVIHSALRNHQHGRDPNGIGHATLLGHAWSMLVYFPIILCFVLFIYIYIYPVGQDQ